MSRLASARKLASLQTISLFAVALLITVGLLNISRAYGDQLPQRSLTLSKAIPGALDTYQLGFTLPSPETLGSIELQICAEGPLVGTPCTSPVGLDMSAVTLGGQSGVGGFSVLSANANTVILTRVPGATSAGQSVTFQLQNITNPSALGSYFGRIQTFASVNATGGPNDYGGLAFAMNNALQVSVTVPPYLYFCVGVTITGTDCTTASGDYINFGNFSPSAASVANSQMVAGTNADTGYNIIMSGNTLTSGNNTIPPLSTGDTSRPGTSQFGVNLVGNSDPQVGQNPSGTGAGMPTNSYKQANIYKFVPGDTVVTVPLPDEPRKYTISYITNIAKSQESGVYVSTLTYICTANF